MDGDEFREIVATESGVIKSLKIRGGEFLDSGRVVAETKATPLQYFQSLFSAFLGTMAFSALTMFYLIRKTNWPEWLLLAGATVLLFWPSFLTDLTGLVLVGLVLGSQKLRDRRDAERLAAA